MARFEGERFTRFLRIVGWATAAFLLALPAIAMQLTDEVRWTALDFVVWGAMLGLVIGAFSGGTHGFFVSLGIMALWMAIGAGLAWGAGKTFRLCIRMLVFVFKTAKKVVKGQPLEPPV